MTREEYVNAVESVLEAHRQVAQSELAAVFNLVPPKTKRMTIDIFIDQDGEGFLSVRVGLEGPDLFVLNRAISPHAELFTTRMTEAGFEPPLPLMSSRREPFSVHDTLTDCAASWIAQIWKDLNPTGITVPVDIVSPEDYGTITPFRLNP